VGVTATLLEVGVASCLECGLIAIAMLPLLDKPVQASEAGDGIAPLRGLWFQDNSFVYSGKIGGGTTWPTGGLLAVNDSAVGIGGVNPSSTFVVGHRRSVRFGEACRREIPAANTSHAALKIGKVTWDSMSR
jgi:hypothetical protein